MNPRQRLPMRCADLNVANRSSPRPVGRLGRAVLWARRRPALAVTLATGMLLAFALVVTVLWWHGQRTALRGDRLSAYADADLSQSARMWNRGEFEASAAVLERARDRLRDFVPPELEAPLTAFDNLELITRLDEIRLERTSRSRRPVSSGPWLCRLPIYPKTATASRSEKPPARHYEEAFRKAGIGAPGTTRR